MDKFKNRAMQVLMGQRAEKAHQEKVRACEEVVMRKQLRSVQRERPRYNNVEGTMLKKQREWIEGLESEAREYKVELRVATSGYQKGRDSREVEDLLSSIAKHDNKKASIAELRSEMEVLKRNIREAEAELVKVAKIEANRRKELSTFVYHKTDHDHERVTHMFGKQLAENRELIAEIRHLCFEKAVVLKLNRLLNKDLQEMSKSIIKDADVAGKLYEQMSSNRTTMARLADGFKNYTNKYNRELNDFHTKFVSLRDKENFMCTKNKPLIDQGFERRAKLRKKPTPNELDRKMYEKRLEEFTDKMKSTDIQEIKETFGELLAVNYSLYRRLGEKLDDTEGVQREIQATKIKICNILAANRQENKEAAAKRRELIEKRDIYKQNADEMAEHIEEMDATVKAYLASTETLLYKLGFTKEDIVRLADVVRCIQPSNITVFLGQIESFVNKLADLEMYLEHDAREKERLATMSLIKEAIPPRPNRFEVIPRIDFLVGPPMLIEEDDALDEANASSPMQTWIKRISQAHRVAYTTPTWPARTHTS